MIGRIFALVLVYGAFQADTVLAQSVTFENVLPSYVAGNDIIFDISLPEITNLGAYNIDVTLTGESGTAGTDFFFDISQINAASTGYVLPSDSNFFDATNLDSTLIQRLTLSDFDATGNDVTVGSNDNVAQLVISTAAGYQGDLFLAIDASGLILDTPDLTPTSVAEFNSIFNATNTAGSTSFSVTAVPEPNTGAIVMMALLGLVSKRRRNVTAC